LRTWAEELGLPEAVSFLEATLDEEKNADVVLTVIAEASVNPQAEAA
jgi:ferritin-like metal-binding protein YciE